MNRIILILFIYTFYSSNNDSLEYITSEITVIDKFNNKTIINADKNSSVSELINSEAGLYIRDYGGIGGIKSISLRGSNANQTAILYNGFKLNSAQNGMFDFSTLDINNLSQIEIDKAGNSSQHGTNAVYGSIGLKSRAHTNKSISINYGNFNTHNFGFSFGDKFNNNTISINSSYQKSDGDFKYFAFGKTFNRIDSKVNDFNINFLHTFNKNSFYINSEVFYQSLNRDIPGPVIFLNTSNNGNINNGRFSVLTNLNYKQYEAGAYYSYNELIYTNKTSESLFGDNLFLYFTSNFQAFARRYIEFDNSTFNINVNYDFNSLLGNMADPNAESFYYRHNPALSIGYSWENRLLNFSVNSRYDYFNDNPDFLSFGSNLTYLFNSFSFGLNLSRNFRVPTFNELYYLNFGNTELTPDKSINSDLTIKYSNKYLNVSISSFYYLISDKIISVPLSPIVWSAQNIAEVENYGLEFSSNLIIGDIELKYNYSYQQNLDKSTNLQIAYSPEETIFGEMKYNYRIFNFNLSTEYTSFRYYITNNNTAILDNYLLINFGIGIYIDYIFTKFNFRINNLLNKQYQIIKSFPMPGINFNLSGEFSL